MLDYLKYRMKLAKLRREESRISKIYQKVFKSYRLQNKSKDDMGMLYSELSAELMPIREEIDILVTSYLRGEARKKFIPLPDFESPKMWEECSTISYQKVLSNLGIATVRSALRNERREKIKFVLQVLAGITGIIGTLIGLFLIIKK